MDDIVSVKTFPDSAVRSYYKKNLSEFTEPRKLNVKEIILSRKSLADSVLGMLKKGASFATLAKKYSERRWSAENGGEIGLSPIYEFGNLKDTLWKSPLGKIVGPIKIQDYYGIFKVIEKQEAHPIPFETIRPQVLARMKADLKTKIVNDYLSLKKQKLKIEINYKKIRFAKFQ
jgi:parvulin-like peptidyl-prolyl isomerase